ncbi:MAG: hypothetical protein K2P60_15800, partial [Lachnospiraceae bacterium]|nr:hypothetical protein [Lachnospiraceae bacterium]
MSKFDDMVKGLEKDLKVPKKVWENYVETLNNLPDKPRVKHHTRKWAAAAAVFALLLVGSTTYAATRYFGLWDFFERIGEKVPREAEELVVKDVEQTESPLTEEGVATYTVKEALCDSETIYIVLEARAVEQGKYFFVPTDAIPEDIVSNWGIDSSMSVTEYAASKGLTPIYIGGGIMNTDELGIAVTTMDFRSVSDDVMNIMMRCGKTEDGKTLDVVCQGTAWQDGADTMRKEITFTLTDMSTSEKMCYVPVSGDIPGTEARVEKAEVIQTDIGTYMEITYYEDDPDY